MPSDDTKARRARVRTLWLKTDREIAETLIDEGFGGSVPRSADGKKRQIASMQRNVWNDREALRKEWRAMKRATSADTNESRGEYLAVLDSYRDIGFEMLCDLKLKGTPRVQALMALTRIEEAKAKATGVAETEPTDPGGNDGPSVPFLGLVMGFAKVTPAAKKQIDRWTKTRGDAEDTGT